MRVSLQSGDALLVVDVQADFVSGSLAVPGAASIVPVLNRYIAEFEREDLPVLATRDWHPVDHVSFVGHGGRWPAHCIARTSGASFAYGLHVDQDTVVVSKGKSQGKEAYSGFEGTDLARLLRMLHVKRLFVGGLATDYCVLNTVRDALRLRYTVFLLEDAIRAVNAHPDDGADAERAMLRAGAVEIRFEDIDVMPEPAHG